MRVKFEYIFDIVDGNVMSKIDLFIDGRNIPKGSFFPPDMKIGFTTIGEMIGDDLMIYKEGDLVYITGTF